MNQIFDDLELNGFRFSQAETLVRCDGREYSLNWQPEKPDQWQCTNALGVWHLAVRRQGGKVILFSSAELTSPVRHLEFDLLHQKDWELDHLLSCGVKMGRCRAFELPVAGETVFESYYTTGFTRDGVTLLITQMLQQPQYAMVTGKLSGKKLTEFAISNRVSHFSGQRLEFAPVTLEAGDGLKLLDDYGKNAAEVRRTFPAQPECGWNSWDFYRWTITEEEVLKNAEFIARDPVLSQHVKRIIIDDGWQYCYGEWEANPLFPSGMKKLSAEISRLGFTPGLWLAPSIVEPQARICQSEPEMLALSEGRQPCLCYECMRRNGFVLDPTVEKSRVFLRELFNRYSAMGYRYFKLDFLERTMDAARFADERVPRSQIIRKLMEPIVEGVAGRSEIMGCNYPFMAGNRFVGWSRIGGDIHARWDNVCQNTPSVASRFWMNKRLWINDPDFALCRGRDTGGTSDKLQPNLVFCKADSEYSEGFSQILADTTLEEQKVLLSIVLMAGGAVNLSDDLTLLNETGLALARKVVSAESGEAARPLDLFEHALPSVWLQKLSHGGRLLLVNWSEKAVLFRPNCPELPEKVRDFWSGKQLARPGETELMPHSCLLLEW